MMMGSTKEQNTGVHAGLGEDLVAFQTPIM